MPRDKEKNGGRESLTTGRTRRALKVGGLTTAVGGNYLWNALRSPFRSSDERGRELLETHLKNAMLIVEKSQELRGTFLKLTQMLSMRNDLLPSEMLEVLSVVQSDVPPMSFDLIAGQIERELGDRPENLFAEFDPNAFAAASLGQVHRARLPEGDEVIVKVQYPGVDETVAQDLKNVKTLLQTLNVIARDVMRQKVDVREVYAELEERLNEELDYENEARNAQRFAELFEDDDEIIIPKVFTERTSRRVLTAEFVEGYKLTDILAPGIDQELKDQVAIKYFRAFWRQVFEFGTLHTDPHPGNYLVTFHPMLAILDFGSIRVFPPSVRTAYLRLARALMDRNAEAAGRELIELGYVGPGEDPAPMVQVLDVIFEPSYTDEVYDPREYNTMERAMSAATIKLENRAFSSPGHSVFLGRALIGLDSYMQQFGSVLNYHRLFEECIREAEERAGS